MDALALTDHGNQNAKVWEWQSARHTTNGRFRRLWYKGTDSEVTAEKVSDADLSAQGFRPFHDQPDWSRIWFTNVALSRGHLNPDTVDAANKPRRRFRRAEREARRKDPSYRPVR